MKEMKVIHEVLIKAVELELPSSQLAMEYLTKMNAELLSIKESTSELNKELQEAIEALNIYEGLIAHG